MSTLNRAFGGDATEATTLVVTSTTQLGDAAGDTVTVYGNLATSGNPTFDYSGGSGTFKTSTGTNTLGGHIVVATGKNYTSGTATAIGGRHIIYNDGAGGKSLDINPATSITFGENTIISGAYTFTTGTGAISVLGDATWGTTKKALFRDSGLYINSSTDGQLDVVADTTLALSGPAITLTGIVTQAGSSAFTSGTGLFTTGGDLQVNGNDIKSSGGTICLTLSGADVSVPGTLTAGTLSFTNASIPGDLDIVGTDLQATTGTLNISKAGSMTTVKGTFNVDQAVTFDSTVQIDGAATLNGTAQMGNAKADTVTFYGDIAANGAQNPDIDFSGSSGTFKSTTGAFTIGASATTVSAAGKIQFRDTGIYAYSSGDGVFDLVSDTTLNITSPTVAITANTACTIDGDTSVSNAHTFTTGTGAVSLNGSTVIATTKTLTMGDATHLGAVFSAYRDNAGAPSWTFTPGTSLVVYDNFSQSGAYTFGTGTGVVSLNGSVVLATTKTYTSGTNSAIGGVHTIYRDGAGNPSLVWTPGTSAVIYENTSISGAYTFGTGTGDTTIGGDMVITGHINGQTFMANAFQYPAPGTDWTPAVTGAGLAANKAAKKCWIPLNFLKIGDEIVSYKAVGDVVKGGGDTVTLDCKLVRVNKADPFTTTDVTGGGIVQVTADGNFDVAATLGGVEVVATDKMYVLEILGTTSNVSATEAILVAGVEIVVNRKG